MTGRSRRVPAPGGAGSLRVPPRGGTTFLALLTLLGLLLSADPARAQGVVRNTASASWSTDAGADSSASNTVQTTVEETVGVTLTESGASTEVGEAGGTDDYQIVLDGRPSADVVITIASGGEVTATPLELTFTPDDWDAPRTVSVAAVDDADPEGAHSDTITHAVSSADPDYDGIAVPDVTVAVGDDDPDPATSTVSADPGRLPADGSSGSEITVRLNDADGSGLGVGGATVTLSSTAGSLSGLTDHGDGTYTSTLTAASRPDTATVSATVNGRQIQDEATVVFETGEATSIQSISGDGQRGEPGAPLPEPFVVTVTDAHGNPVAGFPVRFAVVQGGGTLSNDQPQATDAGGEASTTLTPGTASESQVVTATAEGLDGSPIRFTATAAIPELSLAKELMGPSRAAVGEEVRYRIRIENQGEETTAREVAVLDTLPDALEFVSSDPAPGEESGGALRWQVGEIPPGEIREMDLTTRVSSQLRDTVQISNVARLEGRNTKAMSAASREVELVGQDAAQLSLDFSAEELEVALGETVPFVATLANPGVDVLDDLRLHHTIPDGMRFSRQAAAGIDSARVEGDRLVLFIPGTLATGESRTVRYGLVPVSSDSETLESRATATARGDAVTSTEAVALVRLERGIPLETRTAIGKVWADRDADGVQDPGEPGIEGVDVWTDDGVVATSDADGKYSFRNLRPGRHGFRLDETTLPAGYRLAGEDPSADLVTLDATGWTTPRVNFRVVPRGATLRRWRVEPGDSARFTEREPPGPRFASLAASDGDPAPADAAGTESDGGDAGRTMRSTRASPADENDSGHPADDVTAGLRTATSMPLPAAGRFPDGTTVQVILEPAAAGWPESTYTPAPGWRVVPGSVQLDGRPGPDPEVRRDRSGERTFYWDFRRREPANRVTLQLRSVGEMEAPEPLRVEPLRTAEDRAADARAAVTAGPGVEIFNPEDGTVLSSDRLFVGVRGEPGAPVALFDGDSLIAKETVRIDGVHDFVGVGLSRGPHRLRVLMKNSWNQRRWDSVAVHVSGPPARIRPERQALRMRADGHTREELQVRVLDEWGVPVARPVHVTVRAEKLEVVGEDADPSAPGHQQQTDAAGRLRLTLKPEREAGQGALRLDAADASRTVGVELFPAARPLMVTGVGRIGVGASAEEFGAVTARGRLDGRTSVTLNYDSRNLNDGRDFFGRDFNPLESSRYPLFGDASQRQVRGASDGAFSARIERGLDWLSFGDNTTRDFTEGLRLTSYDRSLNGVAARVRTGPVTWKGFGASTSQGLREVQIRGAGISGPYELDGDIRPGTEQVRVELRDRENPQKVLSEQRLQRFADYELDYETGVLLFKRPIPAADPQGHPIFIVVSFESRGGGPREEVLGVRASLDAGRVLNAGSSDSVRLGLTWVHDGQPRRGHDLAGVDVQLQHGERIDLAAEVSYAETSESTGIAASVDGRVQLLEDRLDLSGSWMKVGEGYRNPANVALREGTEEIEAGVGLDLGPTRLQVEHERQEFDVEDVSRRRTTVGIDQTVGPKMKVDADLVDDHFETGSSSSATRSGELKITWQPASDVSMWTNARRLFDREGRAVESDFVGAGASYRVTSDIAVELQHRRILTDGDSASYSVTELGVRGDVGFGTEARGSYQLVGGGDAMHNAAVLGLDNRLEPVQGLKLNTLFERRIGLDRADVADPVRSLPFLQAEEDYWSTGLGVEFLPAEQPYRLSARGELRNGDVQSTRLLTVAGELSLSRSLALLTRQEFLDRSQELATRPGNSSRRNSLLGLAFRPTSGDNVNALAKFELVEETNPIGGGVLTQEGEELRLIGMAEVIWSPLPALELAGRYAARKSSADRLHEDGTFQSLESRADYIGTRLDVALLAWLELRSEGRLLLERTTGAERWDAAPAVVVQPLAGLELTSGYRFGNLEDPDFAVRGGQGWYLTVGARLTEDAIGSAADYWRPRF